MQVHLSLRQAENKRQKDSNMTKVCSIADIHQACWNSDRKARNPRGPMGRFKFRMNCRKKLRQQSITRHRVPDARLAVLKYQQRRNHAGERANHNYRAKEAMRSELLECMRNRSISRLSGGERR